MKTLQTTLAGAALAFALGVAPLAQAQEFEIETGLEVLQSPATTIEGLHRLYIGRRVSPHFSIGQGIYSAALGDAGGAFFWGFEGVAHWALTDRLGLSFSGFVGGGGGAAQVVGDGTMVRAGVSLDYRVNPAWDLMLSASWIRIDGAPIDGPAYGIGFRRGLGRTGGPGTGMPEMDAIGGFVTQLVAPGGTLTRSGGAQPDITLVGARVFYNLSQGTQLSFGAAGGARGAQGYMQIMAGIRRTADLGPVRLFAEAGVGLAGGGNVDTGAGPVVQAAIGAALPVTRAMDVELSFGAMASVDGGYRGAAVSLGVLRHFYRGANGGAGERWAFSTGIQVQRAAPGFFLNPANPNTAVLMQETAFDYFVGRRLYVSGSALTTIRGGAAGYALGLVGLGYEIPLADRWSLSLEAQLGAAGGGGVNTAGGFVAGLRAEVDYRVGDSWRLSMGLGQLTALQGGGMRPATLSLGLKIPFTTHH
ncbi:MAG: hypothetical protein KDK12_05530 [Rhodobacteraceae bacterium]|nr:hypothetical protein [Paracoccaceae bacterium]